MNGEPDVTIPLEMQRFLIVIHAMLGNDGGIEAVDRPSEITIRTVFRE